MTTGLHPINFFNSFFLKLNDHVMFCIWCIWFVYSPSWDTIRTPDLMLWRYYLIRLPFYGKILLNDSSFLISTFPFMYKLKVNQYKFYRNMK